MNQNDQVMYLGPNLHRANILHDPKQEPVRTQSDTTLMISKNANLNPNELISNFIPRYVNNAADLLNSIRARTIDACDTSKSSKITTTMIASAFVWIATALTGFYLITHLQLYLNPTLIFLINARTPSLLTFTFAAKIHIDQELDILYPGQKIHQILLKSTVSLLITAIVVYFGVKYFILWPIFFLDIHLINLILSRRLVSTFVHQSLTQGLAFTLLNTTMLVVSFFGVVFYSPLQAICQYFSPQENHSIALIVRHILCTESVSDLTSKNLHSSFSSVLWLMGIVNIPSQFDLSYFESRFLGKDDVIRLFKSLQTDLLSNILIKVTTQTTSEVCQQRFSSTIFQIKHAAIVIEAATYFASLVSKLESRSSPTEDSDYTLEINSNSQREDPQDQSSIEAYQSPNF
jgi:hypothetical protein